MNTIFNQLIKAKLNRNNTVLIAKAVCSMTPFALDHAATELDDEQKRKVRIGVADHVRGHSTLTSLETGALLKLFQLVTPELSRAEQFAMMEEETGIKRTQLYRKIAKFDCFGRTLLEDRDVAARCTSEALSLLSEKWVTDDTRSRALDYVRAGNHLTIKVAKEFQRKQKRSGERKVGALSSTDQTKRSLSSQDAEPINQSLKSGPVWKFTDPNLSVVVRHNPGAPPVSNEQVIIALEAALTKARQEFVTTQQQPSAA